MKYHDSIPPGIYSSSMLNFVKIVNSYKTASHEWDFPGDLTSSEPIEGPIGSY